MAKVLAILEFCYLTRIKNKLPNLERGICDRLLTALLHHVKETHKG
jgi:hypothetical protein